MAREIKSVEIVSEEAAISLRLHARRQRREERERLDKMTMGDVVNLFYQDLSEMAARTALHQDSQTAELELPQMGNDDVETYQNPEALLMLAKANEGKALLIEFISQPSKACENDLRWLAKGMHFRLRFFRLLGGWVILEVPRKETPEQSDKKFLKNLGITG